MSKPLFPRAIAERAAEFLVDRLRPGCDRIAIAGSIRRECSEVGDIEIVAIPKIVPAGGHLFETDDEESYLDRLLHRLCRTDDIARHPKVNGRAAPWGSKQKKLLVEGRIPVDLFIVTVETWGFQMALRTGSAELTKVLVRERRSGGLLPDGFRIHDSRVWDGSTPLDTPEERDVFEVIGVPYLEPRLRTVAAARRCLLGRSLTHAGVEQKAGRSDSDR